MIKKCCLSCKNAYDICSGFLRCKIEPSDSNTKNNILVDHNCKNYDEVLGYVYWERRWNLEGRTTTRDYTTKEQSEELIEHGLDPSTADRMWTYDFLFGDVTCVNIISDLLKPGDYDIPAWSLAQLINITPEEINYCGEVCKFIMMRTELSYISFHNKDNKINYVWSINKTNLLDGMVETVKWLLKERII